MSSDPLTTLLLLGTARLQAPPAAPAPCLSEAWKLLDWTQPESAVLSGCALRAAAAGAGFLAIQGVPLPAACPPESLPAAPPAASGMLRRILDGEFPECLPEWLSACAAARRTAAARDLPALLGIAGQQAALRPRIHAILGERGRWLARRMDLSRLFPEPEPPGDEAWETGGLTQRVEWLRHHREADPARAAEALAAVWAQESGDTRAAFLTVIGASPTALEIPLLETATRDRKREVRQLARAALMARPSCAWTARAVARARPLLRVEGMLLTKRLVLQLPEAFDPAWKNDGLEEKVPPGAKGMGPRAWWASQLLACVPLSAWEGALEMEFPQLLRLNKDKESASFILSGWVESATTAPEPATAELLAHHLAGLAKWPLPMPVLTVLQRLVEVLPDEKAARVVEAAEEGILTKAAPAQLFSTTAFPLPAEAAPRWFQALLPHLQHQPYPSLQIPAVRQLALRFPVGFLSEALTHLSQQPALTPTAEAFARGLEFRQNLHTHFSDS